MHGEECTVVIRFLFVTIISGKQIAVIVIEICKIFTKTLKELIELIYLKEFVNDHNLSK